MALSARVTKQSVTKMDHPDANRYAIGLLLELLEGGTAVVFSQTFTEQFVQGEGPATTQARFIAQMQKAVDTYKAEQNIYNSASMNNSVTQIQASLVV